MTTRRYVTALIGPAVVVAIAWLGGWDFDRGLVGFWVGMFSVYFYMAVLLLPQED